MDICVCRYVRAKGAGVPYGEAVRFENGYYSSAVFWCLHTADAVGPDDGFVHPHVCVAGRECFTRWADPPSAGAHSSSLPATLPALPQSDS
jgi:hypothetical protein